MNLFQKAKLESKDTDKVECYCCKSKFTPDLRNRKRGWGMFCSKSCSSKWKNKPKSKNEIRDYKLNQLGIYK
jgi:hypothetical protein